MLSTQLLQFLRTCPLDIYQDAYEIVPTDTDNLPHTLRAIFVGVGGHIRYLTTSATETTLSVTGGSIVDITIEKIFQTGTDADGLVGLYDVATLGYEYRKCTFIPNMQIPVTPSDVLELPDIIQVLDLPEIGNLRITTPTGNIVSFLNIGATNLKLNVRKVHQTGTTISGIIGFYSSSNRLPISSSSEKTFWIDEDEIKFTDETGISFII